MSARSYAWRPPPGAMARSAAASGMKRKCDCGVHGGCARCRSNEQQASSRAKAFVQRSADATVVSRPAASRESTSDFTRLPLNAMREVFNGNADDEGLESVDAPPQGSGDGGTQPAPPVRPTGTKVDTTTSFTQEALKAGFLSGLGIVARMQVLPDSTNWDGKEVVESLQQTSSTCPDTLTKPGPCNGNSHFPIGSKMRGRGVRPEQPAMQNRFYDIHTSQSENLSFLHDATRNPKGLDACETVCRQDYAFDGLVIGSHSIRRQFRKGTFGGHDVTIIDVTKTDLAAAASGGNPKQPAGGKGDAGAPPPVDGGSP